MVSWSPFAVKIRNVGVTTWRPPTKRFMIAPARGSTLPSSITPLMNRTAPT